MYGLVAAERTCSTGGPSRVFEHGLDYVLDLDYWQNLIRDSEDEEAAREALETYQSADIGPPKFWAWRQKEIKALNRNGGIVTSGIGIDGCYTTNKTGCARTEEITPISYAKKSEYPPHFVNAERSVAADNSHARPGRTTRDLKDKELDSNPLKSRTKLVCVGPSRINGRGLFALEDIKNNDMIIEYLGEVIRDSVADFREGRYRRNGSSIYLFTLNPTEGTIIDGTRLGNNARFINHSHEPNCISKVIKVMGEEKIVIYAICNIKNGDELTLNYKFKKSVGDHPIPCGCGASVCPGFILN